MVNVIRGVWLHNLKISFTHCENGALFFRCKTSFDKVKKHRFVSVK